MSNQWQALSEKLPLGVIYQNASGEITVAKLGFYWALINQPPCWVMRSHETT